MADVRFIYVADIYCPWCYAFGPIMKKLSQAYPQFPVKVIGGNLISRPMTLAEDAATQPDLVDFWHEVEKASGRSLAGGIRAVETGADIHLYSPGADEIFTVLKTLAPGHELEQFLYLEEFFYGEGRDLFAEATLREIAKKWQISAASFEKALDQPQALAATRKSLAQASELMGEITSYPSVILAAGSQIIPLSRGFVHYETVRARLEDAMRHLDLSPSAGRHCSRQDGCTAGRH